MRFKNSKCAQTFLLDISISKILLYVLDSTTKVTGRIAYTAMVKSIDHPISSITSISMGQQGTLGVHSLLSVEFL